MATAMPNWQRACAYALLDQYADAIADIKMALAYSLNLKNDLNNEPSFQVLKTNQGFKELVENW